MNLWLRALGAKIARGVWCETYWLPEADLVTLGTGSTVNRGCVVQTHLFHDRIKRDGHRRHRGGRHRYAIVSRRRLPDRGRATAGPASLVSAGTKFPRTPVGRAIPLRPGVFRARSPATQRRRSPRVREVRGARGVKNAIKKAVRKSSALR